MHGVLSLHSTFERIILIIPSVESHAGYQALVCKDSLLSVDWIWSRILYKGIQGGGRQITCLNTHATRGLSFMSALYPLPIITYNLAINKMKLRLKFMRCRCWLCVQGWMFEAQHVGNGQVDAFKGLKNLDSTKVHFQWAIPKKTHKDSLQCASKWPCTHWNYQRWVHILR